MDNKQIYCWNSAPIKFYCHFWIMHQSIFGLRQLPGVVGTLMLAFDNTLDYHAMIELVSPVVIVEILRINWNIK